VVSQPAPMEADPVQAPLGTEASTSSALGTEPAGGERAARQAKARWGRCFYTRLPRLVKALGAQGAELTALNLDKSAALEAAMASIGDVSGKALLAELQFAYIAFLFGQSLEGVWAHCSWRAGRVMPLAAPLLMLTCLAHTRAACAYASMVLSSHRTATPLHSSILQPSYSGRRCLGCCSVVSVRRCKQARACTWPSWVWCGSSWPSAWAKAAAMLAAAVAANAGQAAAAATAAKARPPAAAQMPAPARLAYHWLRSYCLTASCAASLRRSFLCYTKGAAPCQRNWLCRCGCLGGAHKQGR
jgi:hypothetical protein